MEKQEYKNMYEAEDTHFYYVSLHKVILSLLKRHTKNNARLLILDAGCGTGRLAELMKPFGKVIGIDMSSDALAFAKKRGVTVQKASVTKLPFKENSFNVITSIDVLVSKSIRNDEDALREFYRVLKPNGILILRVSAIPWLKLSHDQFVHSNKRYSRKVLKEKLEKAGFRVEKISYMNMLLAPIAVFQHFKEKLFPPEKVYSSITKPHIFINKTLAVVLSSEAYLFHHLSLPFGLGLIAVCKKSIK